MTVKHFFGERCNQTVTETIIEIRWLHLSMSPARECSYKGKHLVENEYLAKSKCH